MFVRKAHAPQAAPPPSPGTCLPPFVLEYVPEQRVAIARFSGTFETAAAWQAIATIKAAVAAHPIEGVLGDVRASDYTPTVEEVTGFCAEFVGFLGRRRLAVLTRLIVQYGLARVLVQQAQARDIDAQAFVDEREAHEWLHRPDSR